NARLVDYPVGDGTSARVFARFQINPGGGVADGVTLAASTPLLVRTKGLEDVVAAGEYRHVLATSPVVFETAAPLQLWRWRNRIAFYMWSDDECRLAKGATAATLIDGSGGAGPPADVEALRPTLSPPAPIADEAWRPVLDPAPLARIDPIDMQVPERSATALARVDPARTSPWLALDDDFGTWTARRDLLESGPFSRDFVIETTIDGTAMVRFGDEVHGLSPAPGTVLVPRGRFGVG